MYSENDWWSYLAHSWGNKPEQKAHEKEYNHEYYERNKERILAARKAHGDEDHKGEEFKTDDNLDDRIVSEVEELEKLMEINADLGGYPDDVMENIKQHNQNIIDNIKALSDKVGGYMKDNPSMSEEQKKELLASLREQIDKAKDMAIDLRKDSSKDYLSGQDTSKKKSSSKSSSKSSNNTSSSSSSSSSSSKKDDDKKHSSGSYARPNYAYGSTHAGHQASYGFSAPTSTLKNNKKR